MSRQPTIAVFGDAFRDVYWIGEATRISPEAPIPVVNVSDTEWMDGGAANVQRNLTALGALTWTPTCYFDTKNHKNRLVCNNQQVARWDENDTCPEITKKQVEWAKNLNADGVIVSDYGKGAISYETIETIASLDLPTFIDTKRDPRDFDIIRNPFFFPNSKEYEAYYMNYKFQPNVIYKRGPLGIEHHKFGQVWAVLPAWATNVVSVCGAGDTVIAAYAYKYFNSVDALEPLEFANAAAAVVIQKPYTAVATADEIHDVIRRKVVHTAAGAM